MDNLTIEQRKKNMRRIRSKNTKPEILFRKALWKKGIRYRIHVKSVLGTPDVCIKSKKIAIFIDSEFWHGKMYLEGKIPKTNSKFWINKFKKNIKRDEYVTSRLKQKGWKVFRFWTKEVYNNLESLLDQVTDHIYSLR